MKTFLVGLLAVIAMLAFVIFTISTFPASNVQSSVTLQAASGNTSVQMFERIGTDADVIKQFPSGQSCLKINGPTAASIEGIAMKFHLLSCNGTTGYINSKYVR